MLGYEYRTTSATGEPVLFTARWLAPQADPTHPVLRVMLYVGGYDKAYFVDLPEAEAARFAQTVAEGGSD